MESHPDGIIYHKESDRFKGDKLVTYALAQFVVTATIFAVVFFFSLSSLFLPHFAWERHIELLGKSPEIMIVQKILRCLLHKEN